MPVCISIVHQQKPYHHSHLPQLHLQLPGTLRWLPSASPFPIGDQSSVVGIVVTGLAASSAWQELKCVWKNYDLGLDYLIRWDYILNRVIMT